MPIRMTTGMMTNHMLFDMNTNLNSMDKWSRQMSTNRRINSIADDPISLTVAMQASTRIARLQHYKGNLGTAEAQVRTAEVNVTQINDILKRVYELTVQATTDVNGTLDRTALAQEVRGLQANLLQLLNTKEGDKYIFAGYNTLQKPFTFDASGNLLYNGLDMSDPLLFTDPTNPGTPLPLECDLIPTIDIGFGGMSVNVSVTGYRLARAGDQNIYNLITDLINTLEDPTASAQTLVDGRFIEKLQEQQSHVLTITAEFGATYNRIKTMEDVYALDQEIHTEQYSRLVDADYGESVLRWKTAEAMYQATLQAAAQVIQPTILDYLR